ncbi:hypothetical protein Tco_0031555 [Tanacetum coccineum]
MQNRAGNANAGQGKPVKCYNFNGVGHIARNCTQPKRSHNSDYFKDKMLLMQAQENGAVLDEEELLFLAGEHGNTCDADVDNQPVHDLDLNKDNIFQEDECDAFDSYVDDEPTAQTIFVANLSSAGSANPQAGLSNASILSEVHTLENAIDHSVTNQNVHEIHNEVKQSNVIDSTSVHMGNNNVILYEQYLTTNDVSVVPSCASSAPNNAYVLIDNNVDTPHEPLVTELAIYKEQVAIYEQRAKFELTEREPRMDDQIRVLIQDHNQMEEKINQELHSVKLQLNHSIKSQTVVQENVNTLQQTFKQRESQLLNDFSNLRKLKDKLETKHFDGVQKSLVTEVRAMKAIFEEMEAEVDKNDMDQKYGEIERKNLLITNENLIANCIAQDVFYTVTNSALSASRFSLIIPCYNVSMNRVVELESENSRLLRKIKHDDHDQSFFKTRVNVPKPLEKAKSLQNEIENLRAQLKGKTPCVTSDVKTPKVSAFKKVEDFQLSIESYQTQLNLTKPGWDATGYEFKHDYTIIESPRAVVFPVDNNNRKIMRFNEIYKCSDGTLTRILKEFIAAIERRLKTRRIYRNLKCFVGGRVRDIDYRLLQRTE